MRTIYSFQTIRKAVSYAVLWMCLTVVHALVMMPLIPISFGLLFVDGFVFATLLIMIGVTYKILIKSEMSSIIIAPQTLLNYISFGLCILLLWLGSGLLFLYIVFPYSDFNLLFPTIPVRVLIGLLLYISLITYESASQKKAEETEVENENEEILKTIILPDEELQKEEEIIERIAVKSGQKIQVILTPEIFYLQADGDYVMIFTEKGKYLKEQTMKYFEEHLPKAKFVRIHRSCIVNIEMVSRIELYKKQQQMLTLKNGHQIKASVAGYKILKSVLQL